MRTMAIIAALAAGACKFSTSGAATTDATDGRVIDTPPDISVDAQACFGPNGWSLCLEEPLTATHLTLPPTLDTTPVTGSSLCSAALATAWVSSGQSDACVIEAQTIDTATDNVVVSGTRPLVLVARETISITLSLDVGSYRATSSGPGSEPSGPGSHAAACQLFGQDAVASTSGAGGGAGGSFITKGGDGGVGNGGSATQAGTAAAADATPPTRLRAGCPGQIGGSGSGGTTNAGVPGPGGGGLYLVAGTSITISGTINASGAGGRGGGPFSGGSGGGAGGMLALYAPSIVAGSGFILANGGSGGGGADGNTAGGDGNDPDPFAPNTAPAGGAAGSAGTNGGTGSAMGSNGGSSSGAGSGKGGGAGGGGEGYILSSDTTLTGATVSPAPVAFP